MTLRPLTGRPLVSVLTGSYNYADYLPGAIESALGQTYAELELVVCDDGSTDSSREILRSYAARDPRVTVLLKENGGQASALNAAYRASKGEVLCFLDADDQLDPRRLELIVDAMRRADAGGAVHPLAVFDKRGAELYTLPVGYRPEWGWIGPRVARRGGRWPVAAGGAIAFRREVGSCLFPIPEDVFTGADADAFLFTLLPLLTPVAYVDQPLYRYRLHSSNEGLLRSLDATLVEHRLAFIHETMNAVNARLSELDPPREPLRLEDNLGYREQKFFLDVFARGRRVALLKGFAALVRMIAADDVYTRSRKAGLVCLYTSVLFVPSRLRAGLISAVRRASYRIGSVLRRR